MKIAEFISTYLVAHAATVAGSRESAFTSFASTTLTRTTYVDAKIPQITPMPPVRQPSQSHTPRLVLYQQTHHTPDGAPISILPLVIQGTGVTHLYVAAVHLNDGPGNISLNDDPPDHPKFNQLWEEVKILQSAGVKVMLMLGGAAKGSFGTLSGDDTVVRPNSRSSEPSILTTRSSKRTTSPSPL